MCTHVYVCNLLARYYHICTCHICCTYLYAFVVHIAFFTFLYVRKLLRAAIIFVHATFVVCICMHLLYIFHVSHVYVCNLLARCYRPRVIWFPAAVISQHSNVLSGHFCNQSFCHQVPRLLNRVEKALLGPIFGTWYLPLLRTW